jgi:enoyl-CoA hydratase/carnithine racemase
MPSRLESRLLYEVRGPIARITINRPGKLNALTQQMYTDLRSAISRAEADDSVEVIQLTGTGRAFCVGGDLAEMSGFHDDERRGALIAAADNAAATFARMETADKPIVVIVNGLAHAGGLILTVQADIAIASHEAVFRLPEALRGIVDPFVAPRLARHIGVARTKYLYLTCAELGAQQAEQWGLVAMAVPHDVLDDHVQAATDLILKTHREARRWNKRMIQRTLPPADPYVLRDLHLHAEVAAGTRAFAERDRPSTEAHE